MLGFGLSLAKASMFICLTQFLRSRKTLFFSSLAGAGAGAGVALLLGCALCGAAYVEEKALS